MAKQSNLEKIGLERRNEHELVRNDIHKNQPYDASHPYAKSKEGQAIGKGTGHGGHGHIARERLDIENGGGDYDINGRPGVDGGRNWLMTINTYDKNNKYWFDTVDTEANIDDGQFYVK